MEGVSVYDFIVGFNTFLRMILHAMIGSNNSHSFINKWLKDNDKITQIDIIRIMELIFQFEFKIKFLDQNDLALELLMVKLCNLDKFSNISNIIDTLEVDEDKNENSHKAKDQSVEASNTKTEMDSTTISSKINEPPKVKENVEGDKNNDISTLNTEKKYSDSKPDIKIKNNNELLSKQKVVSKIDDIINYIDEKNSKIAALLNDIEVLAITDEDIFIKVNNISNFIYDALVNDIDIIKTAFNILLKTNHNIVIEKGLAIQKEDLKNKRNVKDEEHPLFMNFLEKFDGEILR